MVGIATTERQMGNVTFGGMPMPTDPRERVKLERHVRGLSARQASALGGISNTTWSEWERNDDAPTTDRIRYAVAAAFDWPTTWVEDPPATLPAAESDRIAALERRVAALEGAVRSLLQAEIRAAREDRGTPPSS
jgi:transcriptional regulator with XRE-family HTH domain